MKKIICPKCGSEDICKEGKPNGKQQYQYKNTEIPKKKTKKTFLTSQDKRNNRDISRARIKFEHIIGFVKRFKILSDRYRNRRKRLLLRFNLICGICNFDRSF